MSSHFVGLGNSLTTNQKEFIFPKMKIDTAVINDTHTNSDQSFFARLNREFTSEPMSSSLKCLGEIQEKQREDNFTTCQCTCLIVHFFQSMSVFGPEETLIHVYLVEQALCRLLFATHPGFLPQKENQQ